MNYHQLVALLPEFTQTMVYDERMKLWDAMDAAYRAGLRDAAEMMEKAMKNGKETVTSLASDA